MLQHKMNSSSYAKVHNVSSLEDIMSYHNDDVLLKFRKEWNVTPEEADDIFNETKKFIWLASMPNGMLQYKSSRAITNYR